MAITYEVIASTSVSSSTSSVIFSSIPSTYTDIVVNIHAKHDGAGSAISNIRFNGDTNANYSVNRAWSNGSTATGDKYTSQTYLDVAYFPGTDGDGFNNSEVHINNYANASYYKNIIFQWNSSGGASSFRYSLIGAGTWQSASAINQITVSTVSGGFVSGTVISLYGIKRA